MVFRIVCWHGQGHGSNAQPRGLHLYAFMKNILLRFWRLYFSHFLLYKHYWLHNVMCSKSRFKNIRLISKFNFFIVLHPLILANHIPISVFFDGFTLISLLLFFFFFGWRGNPQLLPFECALSKPSGWYNNLQTTPIR